MTLARFRLILVLLFAVLLTTCIWFVLKCSWVSADAPYYLAVARDISEGKTVYAEIVNDYTPLVMVLFSWVFDLTTTPPYILFLAIQLLVTVVSAFLLFRILTHLETETYTAFLVVAAFVLATLSSDGSFIVLETYSVFFVLVATHLFFSHPGIFCYLVTGVVLGLTFLCKQYGVLNFIPFYLYILTSEMDRILVIKKVALLSVGGFLVLVLFIGYYVGLQEVPLHRLIEQLSGGGSASRYVSRGVSPIGFLIGGKVLLLFLPLLFLPLSRWKWDPQWIFCLGGLLVSLIPTMVRGYQHYFIYTFPYLFLGIAFLIRANENERIRKVQMLSLTVAAVLVSVLLILRVVTYRGMGDKQRAMSDLANQHLPKSTPVFIVGGLRYLYLLNDYKNPLLDSVGYDYFFRDMDAVFATGSYLISSEDLGSKHLERKLESSYGVIYIYH